MDDKKIENYWALMLVLSGVMALFDAFLQLQFTPPAGALPLARLLGSGIGAVGFVAIAYHCVIRKRGTKFLTFCLVLTILGYLLNPVLYFSGRLHHSLACIPYYGVFLVARQILGLLWLALCWKMRQVNKRIQKQAL